MGNQSILSEIGSLVWSHPYVSCSVLVFLTPPFFPILRFFTPLLISTALFVVALVTMGPHFEEPADQEDDYLINASEFKSGDEADSRRDDGERDVKSRNHSKRVRSTWSDRIKSWKDSWISWVERKLQNENWKGGSLNDDNVSILQEAFAHRAEEKPRVLTKLATRRIPDEEDRVVEEAELRRQAGVIPALRHSNSWTSDRSFERPPSFSSGTQDLPNNFFSPHPSFSRRHESDVNPLFENVIPPPIDYDMPPLITGPTSITAPLFKSLEDEMNMSDDEYDDHHHSDHEHLEVGEAVDADLMHSHEEIPVVNGNYHQPVENLASFSDEGRSITPEMLHQETTTPEVSLPTTHADSVHTRDIDVTGTHEESAPPADDVPKGSVPADDAPSGHLPVVEERSIPELRHESHSQAESSQSKEELHDIPELEEVLAVENECREVHPAEEPAASLPDEVHDVPATSEAPTHHTSEVLSTQSEALSDPTDVLVPPHFVERSMSLPVHGSFGDTGHHESAPADEDVPPLDIPLPEGAPHPSASLSHAISLPAALNPIRPIILPPKTTDQGPRSPDTDLGTVTTFDHVKDSPIPPFNPAERYNSLVSVSEDEPECQKQLSLKDKILNIETLCDAIPPSAAAAESTKPVSKALQATTEDLVTHVSEKMKSFVEDSPSNKFQPDAPQLRITPPSTKVMLTPSPVKSSSVGAGSPASGKASIRPPQSSSKSFTSQYSSSDDESGDEEIDLDSDVEVVGEDSDSDPDEPPPVKSGTKLKAPPKPPAENKLPAQTVVQS